MGTYFCTTHGTWDTKDTTWLGNKFSILSSAMWVFFRRRLFTQVSVKYFNPHVPIRAVNWENSMYNPFYQFHFVTLYIDKCIVHVHIPVEQRVACNLFSFWPNLRRYCRWWQLERIFDCIFVCWIFQLLNGFDILADSGTNRQFLKPLRKFCLAN